MKKPIFVKVELPPDFELDNPLRINTENSLYDLRIIIGIRRKVSTMKYDLFL